MGRPPPGGHASIRVRPRTALRAVQTLALAAAVQACGPVPGTPDAPAAAPTSTTSEARFGQTTASDDEIRDFAGCYDLSAMASFPEARTSCLSGPDTLVPADSLTAHMVDLLLGGAEVRIRRDDGGGRTVTLRGFERPDEYLFLDPPAASWMHPPAVAAARKARPARRPSPPPAAEPPEVAEGSVALPPPGPPPVVALIEDSLEALPPEASLQLPVPRAVDGVSSLTEGSPSLERLLDGLSRAASRMECGPEGCVCAHPPCIPCPLDTSRRGGVDEDTWAARWIAWYATQGTTSERYLAIRSLSTEEGRLLRHCKFRWGFTGSLDEAVGRWDWEGGRVPAHLVAGTGGQLRALKAHGARLDGAGPPPAGDVQGAMAIVADGTAPVAARVHAIRWLGAHGRVETVGGILRDVAAGDPSDSIRGVALDALESLAARATGDRRPASPREPISPRDPASPRDPVSLEPR